MQEKQGRTSMCSQSLRRWAVFMVVGSVGFCWSSALLAQKRQPPMEKREWEDTGTVEAIAGTSLQMMSSKSEPWSIQVIPGQSKITVEGTAEPSFLRAGVNIRFTGEVDAKGALQGEITELEIYSPQGKSDAGLFIEGADEQAKPIPKLVAGKYDIKGRIGSIKENQITVIAAGKKLSGTLSESPAIKVSSNDLGFAQKGDSVKVKAWYTDATKPDANRNKPGIGLAEQITVTMSEPLVGKKKARPIKSKAKAESAGPATTSDPFGIGK
jgi:hypothetical protein